LPPRAFQCLPRYQVAETANLSAAAKVIVAKDAARIATASHAAKEVAQAALDRANAQAAAYNATTIKPIDQNVLVDCKIDETYRAAVEEERKPMNPK